MKDSGIEWIGEIPEEWTIRKGKTVMSILERPVKDDDGVITCFRDGEVTLRSKRRDTGFTFSFQEAGYQGIEPGDLVVHGMDGFAGAIGISDSRGKATPVLNVLDSSQHKKYLMYYLRTMAYNGVFLSLATGIRVRSCDTNWNKLKELRYILPPLPEQQAIAAFLDTQCGHIDTVISKTRETIKEYKKFKQSLITETVTKGLDPSAPLKDSGIEWIGEIPEHWKVKKLKYICENLDYLREPVSAENRSQNNPIYDYYGASGVIDKIDYYNVDDTVLLIGEDGANLRMRNLPLVYRASGKFWVNNHAHILKPKGNDYDYCAFVMEAADYTNYITGSAQPKLSQGNLEIVPLPIPPLPEQKAIAAYLDNKCTAIDTIISKKEQLIKEMESYKKSLIYEYVTGKKILR